jgi:RNA polymerase sigma factor (sigma-70 family)
VRLRRQDTQSDLARARTDPQAFVAFYDLYARRLLVFFAKRVFDAEAAMDLTSETLAKAYEGRQQFRGSTRAEEQGWLFAIARTTLADFFRDGQAERAAVNRLGVEVPSLTDAEIERIEDLAELQQIADRLRAVMRTLPAEQAEAVELRIIQELDYQSLATKLGVSQPTARARVSRGLRSLATELTDQEVSTCP